MQACLVKDPKARPSAEQLLQHEWLVKEVQAEAAGVPEVSFIVMGTHFVTQICGSPKP